MEDCIAGFMVFDRCLEQSLEKQDMDEAGNIGDDIHAEMKLTLTLKDYSPQAQIQI